MDGKSQGRQSMSSGPKVGPESDTDSMAEYGEGDTGQLCNLLILYQNFYYFAWITLWFTDGKYYSIRVFILLIIFYPSITKNVSFIIHWSYTVL